MNALLELLFAGGSLPPSLLTLRAGATHAIQANPVVYELHFPVNLAADDVARFLAGLTGLLPPWWKRIVTQPVIGFELVARGGTIRHRLIIPPSVQGYLDSALHAHLPAVRYEPVDDEPFKPNYAVEYRTTTDNRALRVDAQGVSSGLLTAVQPLGQAEQIVVQWLLSAAWPTRPARLAQPGEHATLSASELLTNSEAVTARRAKLRAPLLLAVGRIGAQASSQRRAIQLVHRAEGPLHAARAPGVHFRRRVLASPLVVGRMTGRSVPVTIFPATLNVEEAAAVLGWPMGGQAVPGLRLGAARLLPVPQAVPTAGTVLGTATFPGQAGRPVGLSLEARYRHLAITGPTGTGKTTLLTRIALQDLEAGYGLVVIDPKGGDLTRAIMERLPDGRLDDVVVLDPSATSGTVVGYNPLKVTGGNRELVVEQVLGVMKRIWLANWGPRTDALLRACLSTLTQLGGMTICEIEPLLVNPAFRRHLLSQISDPFGVEAAWAQYEAWSDGEQIAAAGPLLNKVQALTTRPRLRAILGQAAPAVDFDRLIRHRQVLLVNLAVGQLGADAAYLLGACLVSGLWQAVSARGQLPEERRPPVMAILDEFQQIVQLPTPAETILAEARSFRLGLVLAHQHKGQLPRDLEQAIAANARSTLAFQASREDAGILARQLGGGLTPEDLMGLPAYEAITTVFAAGSVQPPASIRTEDILPKRRGAGVVRDASEQRWGVSRRTVEDWLIERQHGARSASPKVGRSRRSGQ